MTKKDKEPDFSELRFIRIFTPSHIPKYLVEQIKGRDYDVDDWYKYQELMCMRDTPQGPQLNPLSMLYVIADEGNKVVGMLWCDVEPLSKTLVIEMFSIDSEYWYKGKAAFLVADKVKEIGKECKLKKVVWVTRGPKHSEYYGFKKAKESIMEYDLEKDPGYGVKLHRESKNVERSVRRKHEADRVSTADGPVTVGLSEESF